MIHEQAIALSLESDGKVRAKVDRKGACETCHLKSGCGQKMLSQASSKSCIEFTLENTLDVKEGDLLEIGIPEKALIQASLLMYLIPLVSMLLFALLGDHLFAGESEWYVILSGVFGLALGFYVVRIFSSRVYHKSFEPQALKIISSDS